jgi:hypothetical protein
MPKKTKKEKILAMYHKKLRMLENQQAFTSPVKLKTPNPIIQAPTVKEEKIEIPESKYFFSDLKKSLLLIVLIIGVEVALYFAHLIK